MKPVFADAFYFIAILNPRDLAHRAAIDFSKHGITEALTEDHHFEQAGFVALLK